MSVAIKIEDYHFSSPLESARTVLRSEADALMALMQSLGKDFESVIDVFENIKGRVIVTGMGKSGHIARKIAATLSSTGTPSQFVHPSEASHGDLGMINREDAVLALSNSGNTKELSDIIHYCKRFSIPLVGITSRMDSFLGNHADIVLSLPAIPEACPLQLAPTTSTTMMLALGDALSVVLLERKGFSSRDFKQYHPGGQLGYTLLKVEDLMHLGKKMPLISVDNSLSNLLIEMSAKSFGCVGVLNEKGDLIGVLTDGDLRRHLDDHFLSKKIKDVMTKNPKTIKKDILIAEATAMMNNLKITSMFILEDNKPVGILHLHDCLKMGK